MNYKRNIELMVGQFTTAITSHVSAFDGRIIKQR